MMKKIAVFIVFLLTLSASQSVFASDAEKRVGFAADVLAEINTIPEREIPPALLRNCYGIAIIPNTIKLGFILGGRYGRGVLAVKDAQNNWQKPFMITIAGGSLGWQIGAEASDIILVFKSRKSVDRIRDGKFTLGLDAAVAAGPVGRHAEVGTDLFLKSEIYSYSRSRGAFAGIALEGGVLQYDMQQTKLLYQSESYDASLELQQAPAQVSRLLQLLNKYTQGAVLK